MTSELSRDSVLIFYGWWQLSVCLFAFLGLMAIWWHLGKTQGDKGQVWLALSILCWSMSGAVELIFIYLDLISSHAHYLEGFRSIFSLINSLFILMGLPWFRYLPTSIKPIIQSRYWLAIIGLPFLFSLLPTVSKMLMSDRPSLIAELDVYYSLLTIGFLGYVLWSSFHHRRLQLLAWLSVICTLTIVVAQLYKFAGAEVYQTLFSAIFKTTLIMIFFALALSWVKEIAERPLLKASEILLSVIVSKDEQNRMAHKVRLGGSGLKTREIPLSPANHELLKKFIEAKLDNDRWLEIRPKHDNRTNIKYDIRDYNELKRLVASILDGIYGKSNWSREQHEVPFKDALFEASAEKTRRLRLAIPAANISMENY